MFERFNFLIADFVSLFAGFISLFARLGNLLSGATSYQPLSRRKSVAGGV
jgi:hypothetical protein